MSNCARCTTITTPPKPVNSSHTREGRQASKTLALATHLTAHKVGILLDENKKPESRLLGEITRSPTANTGDEKANTPAFLSKIKADKATQASKTLAFATHPPTCFQDFLCGFDCFAPLKSCPLCQICQSASGGLLLLHRMPVCHMCSASNPVWRGSSSAAPSDGAAVEGQ